MNQYKELESIKVIRYLIRKLQKDTSRAIIFALQNNNEGVIDKLYEQRERFNGAYKYFTPNNK